MANIYDKLKEKNITLPAPPPKGGVYTPVMEFGDKLPYHVCPRLHRLHRQGVVEFCSIRQIRYCLLQVGAAYLSRLFIEGLHVLHIFGIVRTRWI